MTPSIIISPLIFFVDGTVGTGALAILELAVADGVLAPFNTRVLLRNPFNGGGGMKVEVEGIGRKSIVDVNVDVEDSSS